MNFANEITICASGGVVLATAGAMASVYPISHSNRLAAALRSDGG
jgi:hypothetical protein